MNHTLKAVIAGVYGAFYHVRILNEKDIPESFRSFALVQKGHGAVFLAKPRGKLRLDAKSKNAGYNVIPQMLLAIGDYIDVEFTKQSSDTDTLLSITAFHERKNSMHRAAFARNQCLAANLNHVVIMTAYAEPAYNPGFTERVLAESVIAGIDTAIVLNKEDLKKNLSDEILAVINERISFYSSFGIHIFHERLQETVSDNLRSYLHNGRSLLVGLSGSGKSTLLNKISGEKIQQTAEVSDIKKGRHTTTNPIAYLCDDNIELIDVPGLREYGLQHRNLTQLRMAFPEFYDYPCRFENCSHKNEPGCGVQLAVNEGKIPAFRYQSFLSLTEGLSESYKPRKGDYWRGIRN